MDAHLPGKLLVMRREGELRRGLMDHALSILMMAVEHHTVLETELLRGRQVPRPQPMVCSRMDSQLAPRHPVMEEEAAAVMLGVVPRLQHIKIPLPPMITGHQINHLRTDGAQVRTMHQLLELLWQLPLLLL